jgi:predicted amidohydrolase
MSFTLAMVQMRVEGGQKQRNLHHARELIGQAASQGAQVVLLPEAMPLGWTHSSARREADAIPDGETCAMLREVARAHRIYVCSGVIERAGERIFNSAVLIGPDGDLLLHHRKLNELDIAHDLYARGNRLNVAETPLGTFGLMICADAFVQGQVISRTLGVMGAQVILSPCAWAVDANHDNQRDPYGQLWLDNYQPVAREFRLWIAGCSNVGWITDGPWKGRKCIGCSLVISPTGDPVTRGPYGSDAETILLTKIDVKEQ